MKITENPNAINVLYYREDGGYDEVDRTTTHDFLSQNGLYDIKNPDEAMAEFIFNHIKMPKANKDINNRAVGLASKDSNNLPFAFLLPVILTINLVKGVTISLSIIVAIKFAITLNIFT